jgi:signal transduction histidine kinase
VKADEDNQHRDQSAIQNYPVLLHRYARLVELTTDLASTLDLGELLQHIVDAAQELTESEAASLLLFDPQTRHLYFEAATNEVVGDLGHAAVPIENSIAGWVFVHNRPLVVEEALNDPRFFREVDLLTHFYTRSVIGVPLRTKDKTLGVIEAVNKHDGAYAEEDTRILQALAAQAAVAIENSRLFQQSDLVAEMVHELRTPLAALSAAAHLLQRPDLPPDQRQKISQNVSNEVHRLNEMATDFLELARLESGRTRFEREPVHLGGLLRECLEIIRPLAEAEKVTLDTDIDRSISPIMADRNRLKQVLLNLLTNAIKYNREDGTVGLAIEDLGAEVRISVADSGRGIPVDSLPHIFERFYRVPDQEGRVGGSGLGLAIAKRIVETHHGRFEVDSSSGEGSTFTLYLPFS